MIEMRDSPNPSGTEIVTDELDVPWAMDFSPDKRLFFTEREGRVKVLENNEIQILSKLKVEAKRNDEGGLLGITLSPKFTSDNYLYIYYTYSERGTVMNRVSRFTLRSSELIDEKIIIDKIPGGRVHNGGRIKFGPDGKLYVTTGETWKRRLAQELWSLGGKILRLNPDGSIPTDNPINESPIFSYGNRNPQGIDWHPKTGTLFASEHGPSGENNWRAHDEINVIKPGKNYGWPEVIGSPSHPDFEDPIVNTGDETWAPSGICFYSGNRFMEWKNALLVANLRGRHLRVIKLEGPDYETVLSSKPVYNGKLGRLRDVIMGPDEFIYICTSNRDGRGDPRKEDDMIIRVTNIPI